MMKRRNIITIVVALTLMCSIAQGNPELKANVASINFGHIGVDYNLYYTFEIHNTGTSELVLHDVRPSCDCSKTYITDTIVAPGQFTTIKLRFNTKNWYGDTDQYITIKSNDPKLPTVQIPYKSFVGQYIRGIVPNPKALFLLPGKSQGQIEIANTNHDLLDLEILDQADPFYRLAIVKNRAEKREKLVIKVIAETILEKGTHESSFRIQVNASGRDKPTIVTIPIKIVKY